MAIRFNPLEIIRFLNQENQIIYKKSNFFSKNPISSMCELQMSIKTYCLPI